MYPSNSTSVSINPLQLAVRYPQLAGTIHPQELYPGVSVTTLSGMLSFKNNHHMLHPHPQPRGKQLWGQPSVDGIIKALRDVRLLTQWKHTHTHARTHKRTCKTHTHVQLACSIYNLFYAERNSGGQCGRTARQTCCNHGE